MILRLFITALLAFAPAAFAADDAYRIGPQDVLTVDVYDEPELSGKRTVTSDGTVFVALIDAVEVEGLTAEEAAERIAEELRDGYLVSPQVSVAITEYRSQKVSVVGAVKNPGEYYLSAPTTLLEMLARAGNVDGKVSAGEVRVRRANGDTVVMSLDALFGTGDGDLQLRAGDIVSIPEGQFVYVAGEVQKPGAIVFWDGLTVTQALTKAGGPSEYARLKGAYILRDGERVPVNLKRILDGREADMTLEPGDQLVLKQSPI